jgi:hypothetical protein
MLEGGDMIDMPVQSSEVEFLFHKNYEALLAIRNNSSVCTVSFSAEIGFTSLLFLMLDVSNVLLQLKMAESNGFACFIVVCGFFDQLALIQREKAI